MHRRKLTKEIDVYWKQSQKENKENLFNKKRKNWIICCILVPICFMMNPILKHQSSKPTFAITLNLSSFSTIMVFSFHNQNSYWKVLSRTMNFFFVCCLVGDENVSLMEVIGLSGDSLVDDESLRFCKYLWWNFTGHGLPCKVNCCFYLKF